MLVNCAQLVNTFPAIVFVEFGISIEHKVEYPKAALLISFNSPEVLGL